MEFIQVATVGLRGPDGKVHTNLPMYIRREDVRAQDEETGEQIFKTVDLDYLAKKLAKKYAEYKSAEGVGY